MFIFPSRWPHRAAWISKSHQKQVLFVIARELSRLTRFSLGDVKVSKAGWKWIFHAEFFTLDFSCCIFSEPKANFTCKKHLSKKKLIAGGVWAFLCSCIATRAVQRECYKRYDEKSPLVTITESVSRVGRFRYVDGAAVTVKVDRAPHVHYLLVSQQTRFITLGRQ
jgi:hypothetical protein